MKDIDFDELDKAVTSLMGSVPATDETGKPDDDIKTLVLTPSKPLAAGGLNVPVSAAPAVSTPMPTPSAPVPVSEPTPVVPSASATPQVSPAARRAGRFMDVVHPSSDMTKSMGVSRHSGVIEPLNNNIVTEPATEPTPTPISDESVTGESQPDLPDLSHHATSDWPDPLDLLHSAPVESDNVDAPVVEASESVDIGTTPTLPTEPLSSPFLPDAKVEKRPLGGTVSDSLGDELEAPTQNNDTPILSSDPQTTPTETVLPEELQGDLMAIESRQADTAPAVEPAEPKPSVTPAPVPVQPRPATAAAPVAPTGPTSIPQQYKAEPSTGDQTNGSIYDTDTYHKPLEHPAKKKSSAVLIIWIVVLLVIGAGGGAAAYFYLLK